MSTMYTYSLYAFLLMRETGDRLISGLVDNGFSVTPCLTGDKAYYTGDVSTLTCLMLKHSEKDSNKIYNMIFNIIKDKEIPCFGYVLLHGNGGAKFFGGFMPMQKKVKMPEQGPYRTNGDVIPFPKKDDGIIDDKKPT